MRALCWNGINDLSVETVDDPVLLNPHDVIVQVRLTTTCGSDLHFIDGYLPGMREGDVFGHEFMGEVVEVGPDVTNTRVGDRVVVPSFIACNHCWYCEHDLPSLCDTTNPNAELQQPLLGYPSGGIYGYTHPFGGYQGSHAQHIRVPFGDANCFPIPNFVTDEHVVSVRCGADRIHGRRLQRDQHWRHRRGVRRGWCRADGRAQRIAVGCRPGGLHQCARRGPPAFSRWGNRGRRTAWDRNGLSVSLRKVRGMSERRFRRTPGGVSSLGLHLVWCPKYRRGFWVAA